MACDEGGLHMPLLPLLLPSRGGLRSLPVWLAVAFTARAWGTGRRSSAALDFSNGFVNGRRLQELAR